MTGRGKQFELEIRRAFESVDSAAVDRFADPLGGYAGHRNFCDISVYQYPYKYYFECKERKGNTLNFKADITEDQWKGLEAQSKKYGVTAGILVWFIDHDINAFVPIESLLYLKDQGLKSLNVKDIIDKRITYLVIPGTKRRVLYTYDGFSFLGLLKGYTSDRLRGAIKIGKE